jgi:tetratricopeptide (TPR) repeat protein
MKAVPGWSAIFLAALLAAGCTTLDSARLASTPAAEPASAAQTPPKLPAAQAASKPAPSPAHRLDLAVTLLEKGDSELAKTELKKLLAEAPDNQQAVFLMRQIDTPLVALYPQRSFAVKLAPDGSLSELAQTYLGNPLAFYGLARLNAIPVPANVKVGRIIRIPGTETALAARARLRKHASAPDTTALTPKPRTVMPGPRAEKELADRYYKDGLIAFQRQDLDGAIAAWNKALTIDPGYKDAALNRAEALRLKANLKKMGG